MDREKVIKSIKACAHHPDHDCESCDYCDDNLWCYNDQLIEDFISLLKEQPEIVRCKDCKYSTELERGLFCVRTMTRKPGEALKVYKDPDWFCADGKKDEDQMKRPKETFWDSMSEAELIEPMHRFQD